ncbi:MAG: FecR family protein [Candidatus Tritonobacter lacicola]|nr:FecR family protein [Candidatus Tritonobacter lacicola]
MKAVARSVVIIVLALVISSFSVAAQEVGYVANMRGAVEVMRQDAKAWKPLAIKGLVYLNDSVRTKPQSKVNLVFKDGSELNLGHNSEVKITEFHYNPAEKLQQSSFQAARGIMRAKVGKLKSPKSRFEIKTATAICGVMGTEYVVEIPGAGLTRSTCLKGDVVAKSSNPKIAGETKIGSSQACEIPAGKAPGPAKDVGKITTLALVESTTIVRAGAGALGGTSMATKAAIVGGGAAVVGTGISVPIGVNEAQRSSKRDHDRRKRHREYYLEEQRKQQASPS